VGCDGGVQGVQAQCPTATADAIGPQEDLVEKSKEAHEGTLVIGRVDVETADSFESVSTPAAMSVSSDDGLEEVSEVWDLGSDSDSEHNCSSERGCGNPLLTKETQSGATLQNSPSDERSQDRIKIMKREHDLAKAVKSDDAEVPVHLWDSKVCRGPATLRQAASLQTLREAFLRVYRKRLWRDCQRLLRKTHDKKWFTMHRQGNVKLNHDLDAIRDILWRAAQNTWFDYPSGSRLLYWRFPIKYQRQARDGVPVYFIEEGPTSMKPH